MAYVGVGTTNALYCRTEKRECNLGTKPKQSTCRRIMLLPFEGDTRGKTFVTGSCLIAMPRTHSQKNQWGEKGMLHLSDPLFISLVPRPHPPANAREGSSKAQVFSRFNDVI